MRSMNRLILMIAGLVSLLMVVGTYLIFSGFGDKMLQRAAFSQSHALAHLTFSNMFQLMSRGWSREEVISFTDHATRSVDKTPIRVEFYRAPGVSNEFGSPAVQAAPDEALQAALSSGNPREIPGVDGVRFIYPLVAEASCLSCHQASKVGDVMGAITVHSRYDDAINTSRKILMLVLLLLSPVPFVAAWLVTLYLDSRFNRFVDDVNQAIARAQEDKSVDLSGIQPGLEELDEVLESFKKMACRQKRPE